MTRKPEATHLKAKKTELTLTTVSCRLAGYLLGVGEPPFSKWKVLKGASKGTMPFRAPLEKLVSSSLPGHGVPAVADYRVARSQQVILDLVGAPHLGQCRGKSRAAGSQLWLRCPVDFHGKKRHPFWLVEVQGEPFRKKRETRAPLGNRG